MPRMKADNRENTVNRAALRYPVHCVHGIVRPYRTYRIAFPSKDMLQDASDLAAMAEALSQSADYRVLRRLMPRPASQPALGQDCRTGILLDTETTGLHHARDE